MLFVICNNKMDEVPLNVFMTELILGWAESTCKHGKLFIDLN